MAYVIALGFAAFFFVHSRHKEAVRQRMEAERKLEACEREKRQAASEPREWPSEDPSLLSFEVSRAMKLKTRIKEGAIPTPRPSRVLLRSA